MIIILIQLMSIFSLSLENYFFGSPKDKHEAIHYLKNKVSDNQHKDSALPIVILIDINIPVLFGLELLAWIKRHSELKHIPVVVMSNSEDKNQVMQVMNLGASSYFHKSSSISNLIYLVKALVPWLLRDYDI
ncbi:MAG: response regulator [Rhizonema sp. PD38]|nr:response regulator [Rhizonema sp. PD38]